MVGVHPEVRDLLWSFESEPLMDSAANLPGLMGFSEAESLLWREGVERFSSLGPLHKAGRIGGIDPMNWRVGLHFEALVEAGLRDILGWEVLGSNVSVTRDRQTLGAFDLIVRLPGGEVEHWELAVKFYLDRGGEKSWSSWIGPNQRDRLDKKLSRMRDHQLPLSSTPEGKSALHAMGIEEIHRKRAWVKGRLFSPWGGPQRRPEGGGVGALGQWIEAGKRSEMVDAHPGSRWFLRGKPSWLSDVVTERGTTISPEALLVSEVPKPEMWSRLEEGDGDLWEEKERWFFVPDGWQERALELPS